MHDPVSYLPPSGLLTVTINLTNKASNEHNYLFVDTGQSYVQRTDKYVLRRNYHKSLNLQQEHMNQLCQKEELFKAVAQIKTVANVMTQTDLLSTSQVLYTLNHHHDIHMYMMMMIPTYCTYRTD